VFQSFDPSAALFTALGRSIFDRFAAPPICPHTCMHRPHWRAAPLVWFAAVWVSTAAPGCAPTAEKGTAADTVLIYIAASLTRPMQPVLADYSTRTHAVILTESGASVTLARRVTELHRIPDLIILADPEVFPELLMPRDVRWYAEFARNRMVVAYTPRSKHAAELAASTWTDVLRRPDVEVGRTDPAIAPVGARTLIMFQLAEQYYHRPGLAKTLLANAPERNVRPDAAQTAALLAAGELDYIYDYQSVAEANGFRFLTLPRQIDLSDPALASEYATARIRVRRPGSDSAVTIAGHPITYALSIPVGAPHAAAGERFMNNLLSAAGVAKLRAAHVDMLDHPLVSGGGAPAELRRVSGG